VQELFSNSLLFFQTPLKLIAPSAYST